MQLNDKLAIRLARSYHDAILREYYQHNMNSFVKIPSRSTNLEDRLRITKVWESILESFVRKENFNVAKLILSRTFPELLYSIKNSISRYESIISVVTDELQKRPPSFIEIFEEVKSFQKNFPNASFSKRSISIISHNISLEDENGNEISLGRFKITLDLNSCPSVVDGTDHMIYAEALDPNPAREDYRVTHPHVKNNYICMGNGSSLVYQAYIEGRLEDVFKLLISILNTYNDESPYIRLEEWVGIECENCRAQTNEEEYYSCDRCGNMFCDNCGLTCRSCEGFCCSNCLVGECEICNDPFCENCILNCTDCSNVICQGCASKCEKCENDFCSSCLEECKCSSNICSGCASECESCNVRICDDCMCNCENCGNTLCEKCMIVCENCDNEFCKNCYDEDECSLLAQTTE